jgi:hydrogenase nickel incorporation protein HypA/HybF
MHELAICQALISQLDALARTRNAVGVERVTVQVGPLSGVVPDLLHRAYTLASADTIACGAELILEECPIRVYCDECRAESIAQVNRLTCSQCGNWRTRLLSGDELMLMRVELLTDETLH